MNERSSGLTDSAPPADESAWGRVRFTTLWARNLPGATVAAEPVHGRLIELYGEPHRRYHTLNHIRHCLREFDGAAALMVEPDAVEMALWFHDAIYQPGAKDNERRSADLFQQWSGARANPAFQQRVDDLIMATTHREPPDQGDAKFLVDIDLSSFGLPWEACERDGRLIRAEFAGVADDQYYPGHLRFLRTLQDRATFFCTEFFQQRYEPVARANLARIIADLRARGYR
jgi:predicted metal-dependent HD superfamily phosphohydrolase